jgi:hypothetical protein
VNDETFEDGILHHGPARTYRTRVLRRTPIASWFPFAPAAFLVALAAFFGLRGAFGAIGPPLLLAALLSALARGRLRRHQLGLGAVGRRAATRVEDDALIAETTEVQLRLPRRRIRRGYLVPNVEGGAVLVLEGRLRILLELWLPKLDLARALLDELKLSPRARPQVFRFFFGLEVTVGVDGVVIASPLLGRRRFVPHGKIDDVGWSGDHVRLVLTDGTTVEIATGAGAEREVLVERLLHARSEFRRAEGAEAIALLARAGRDTKQWVQETRALGGNAGTGYRATSVPEETLWRIALDPSEKQELRIGASLALGPRLDDGGKQRLREAAEAAASPRVRVALEAVAEAADEDMLIETIGRARSRP